MSIEEWRAVLGLDDMTGAQRHVAFAEELGRERYGDVVSEAFSTMIGTTEFAAVVTTLVTGSLAFDALPMAEIEVAEGYRIKISIESS